MDDTICYPNHSIKETHGKYALAKPNLRIIEHMRRLKEDGFHIIIHSARRMLTHDGDIDKIVDDVGQVTVDWLTEHEVPYDQLIFGKPYANTYYVDDKAMNLNEFYDWMTE